MKNTAPNQLKLHCDRHPIVLWNETFPLLLHSALIAAICNPIAGMTAWYMSSIAGTGSSGYSGDGSQAVCAQLSSPQDVGTDGAGGYVVADTGNHRVRQIHSSGTITTIAGTGSAGYSGEVRVLRREK